MTLNSTVNNNNNKKKMMSTKNDNKSTRNIISAYAPTMENTIKNPEDTKKFYDQLTSVIKLARKRQAIIIGGDFNAKTKSPRNRNIDDIVGKINT